MANKITGLKKWRNGEIFNARDYVFERDKAVDLANQNYDDIDVLEGRLDTAELDIIDVDNRLTTAEADIISVTGDLATHEAATNPHNITPGTIGAEPAFTKNTAFNKNFAGTGSATTVARSDHTHLETDITDLNKYTQQEVDAKISDILDGTTPHTRIHLQDTTTSAEIYFVDGDETDNGSDTVYIDLPSGTTIKVGKLDLNDVRNANGAAFVKGQVLAITGVQGDEMTGIHADPTNTTDFIQYKTFGVVNNGFNVHEVGDVITRGVITNIPAVNFAVAPTAPGQFLWVVSGGELSTTPPAKPSIQHLMGLTLKVHGSLVDIFVYDRFFQKLSDSSDVSFSTLRDKDILVYNASTGLWENSEDLVLDGNLIDIGADGNQLILKNAQTHLDGEFTDVGVKLLAGNENIIIDPQGINKTTIIGNLNTTGDLNLGGDLFINGNTVQVNFDSVETRDDTLTLRSEATGALGAGAYSGLIAKLADGTNDSGLLFNGNGVARVGDITVVNGEITSTAQTQALATREDSPIDNGIAHWDSATSKFETNNNIKIVNNGIYLSTFIANSATGNNASIVPSSTGTQISRNVADANPALVVNQANTSSTGNIQSWQFGGVEKVRINPYGSLYAGRFSSISDANYYLEPSSTGTSLNVAGSIKANTSNTIGWANLDNGAFVVTDGTNKLALDTNEIVSNNSLYLGTTSGDLIIRTGGSSERMRILGSGGNVGIGTTSPNQKLSLQNNGETNISISTNLGAAKAGIYMNESDNGTTNGAYVYYDGSTNKFNIATGTTSMVDRFTILRDTGDVGIGTTSPLSRLHVDGEIWMFSNGNNPRFVIGDTNTSGNYGLMTWHSSTDTLRLGTSIDTNTITINESSNVGIGTDSPQAKLEVAGEIKAQSLNIDDKIYADIGADEYGLVIEGVDGSWSRGYRLKADDKTALGGIGAKGTGNSLDYIWIGKDYANSDMSILPNGNIGIGTTSPSRNLHIKGGTVTGMRLENPDGGDWLLYSRTDAANGTTTFSLFDETAGADRLGISDTGNVGIANTNPQQKLDVTGNARVSGQYQYGTAAYTEYNSTDQTIDFVFN